MNSPRRVLILKALNNLDFLKQFTLSRVLPGLPREAPRPARQAPDPPLASLRESLVPLPAPNPHRCQGHCVLRLPPSFHSLHRPFLLPSDQTLLPPSGQLKPDLHPRFLWGHPVHLETVHHSQQHLPPRRLTFCAVLWAGAV